MVEICGRNASVQCLQRHGGVRLRNRSGNFSGNSASISVDMTGLCPASVLE
jgi:hypothetical protein